VSGLDSVRFHTRARKRQLRHARSYLRLATSREQADRLTDGLQRGKARMRRVEDVLRAARREPLPASDPQVKRQLRRAHAGKALRPLLLVTLPDGRDDIADGLHEASAMVHELGPKTRVPVVRADDTKRGGHMAKKVKVSIAKQEKTLTELEKLAKRDDLSPGARESVRKSQQELQLAYLERVSPAGAAAWRQAHPDF
jgi:hypothetical protein